MQLDYIEVNTGKDDIILIGGNVCVNWLIDFFHGMIYYVLTINNCGKLREGSNEGVYFMFPQFQAIKDTSIAFTINKNLEGWLDLKVVMRYERQFFMVLQMICF